MMGTFRIIRRIILNVPILLLLLAVGASADIARRAGTTSAQFLRLEQGARHAALGGTYTGYGDDAFTLWGQPAALGEIEAVTLSAQHTSLFMGINQEYVGVAFPLGSHRWGLTANLLNVDDILRTTENATGNLASSGGFFGARDLGVALHYGRRWTDRVTIGAAVRYIDSEIDNVSAQGVGVDAGIRWRTPIEGLTVGAAVTNAGQGLKFIRQRDDLPTTFRAGGAYVWNRWMLSGDLVKGIDTDFEGGVGLEFRPIDLLALRAGYRSQGRDVDEGLTAGLGVRWKGLELDYAYVPFGDLGDAHRVSGTVRWGGGGGEATVLPLAPKRRGERK